METVLPETCLLKLDLRDGVLSARIDDPATRNAMSDALMAEFEAVLAAIDGDRSIRALVVRGTDGAFCAGADLKSTREALASSPAAGEADPLAALSVRAGRLFARFQACPAFTVAVVDGPAMGGGFGLVCCMDMSFATDRARFALPETMLGIPPSQIAPYVVARIGRAATRRLAMTGQRLSGAEAAAAGLVDESHATAAACDERVAALLAMVARCAPHANAETKRLVLAAPWPVTDAYMAEAAQAFAACLRGPEGREGLDAFAAKRPAAWMRDAR